MAILINKDTRVLIQGITGREGSFHAKKMLEYGTKIIAGVTPGKGGMFFENKIPVFDSVEEAIYGREIDATIVFVPPFAAPDAILEAIDAKISLIVAITEGIPVLDTLQIKKYLTGSQSRLIGPNCPGIITPEECKIGIMPGNIHKKGNIGVVSRSGTLTYEAVKQLTDLGIGQSTCVGIGGDPIIGTNFIDILEMFESDSQTEAVVMLGEIGGNAEEEAAEYIRRNMSKPVIGFIAGLTAPPEKRMGHAGAIIGNANETAAAKIDALEFAGVTVAKKVTEIGKTAAKSLKRR
ncbi:MAG: succinate--CoA ligase subunit alpha [Patescibacteria group bacterium]